MTNPGDTSAAFCDTLVDEWILQGVAHAVVAPGSRSTPLAVAIARRPEIALHVFHDERTAGFVALGIGRASGVPAVLLCTSGTAAAHFVAPVMEAHLSRVPVIVCTADRPPELRDVSAPQTVDQTRMFGASVRWFHDPGVPSSDAGRTWRSLARRAMAATMSFTPGPVHLNLPFREPLLGDSPGPEPRDGAVVTRAVPGVDAHRVSALAASISGRRGVIVAGRGATDDVLGLAESLGWPVFADAVSGLRECHPRVVVGFDPVLRSQAFVSRNVPEVVLRIGDPPASKVLAQWITASGAAVVQVVDHGLVVDPDHNVRETIVGPVARIVSMLAGAVDPCSAAWSDAWSGAESAAQRAITLCTDAAFGEPTVARRMTDTRSPGSHLVVSSSMPIRDVEWFGTVTPGVTVHSNRGANGIDGVVSTAVGIALATGRPTTVHIGDVAMVHDSNSLWGLAARGLDITVITVNNDGGSIFSFLPQASQVDAATFETLYGTPHGVDFAALCAAHGVAHVRVRDRAGLDAALANAATAAGVRMIEVVTDRSVNVPAHEAVNAAVVVAVDATVS